MINTNFCGEPQHPITALAIAPGIMQGLAACPVHGITAGTEIE